MSRAIALLLATVVAVLVAACGASSSASPTSAPGGPLTVKAVWARAATAGQTTAVYFTIVNGKTTVDALTGVSVAPEVAGSASVHETMAQGSGMMGMQPVAKVEIPGGATVEFKPGGYHVMLMELKQDLKVGDQVKLTLTFTQAGAVPITAEVKAN